MDSRRSRPSNRSSQFAWGVPQQQPSQVYLPASVDVALRSDGLTGLHAIALYQPGHNAQQLRTSAAAEITDAIDRLRYRTTPSKVH